jgi:2,4-dienoyl-CoA reductase-like NADH-dependent reductase (Old Yellow Enzyme family)
VGDAYPLLVKYNGWERIEKGITPDEGVRIGERLARIGYDGLEVSCGMWEDGFSTFTGDAEQGEVPKQGYNRHVAAALSKKVDVPVFLVGGLTDTGVMEEILLSDDADYISLSRALIAEPDFPNKIFHNRSHKTRCVHCNLCVQHLSQGPLCCYHGKEPDPTQWIDRSSSLLSEKGFNV